MLSMLPTILAAFAISLALLRPLAPAFAAALARPELQRWSWLPPTIVGVLSSLSAGMTAMLETPPVFSPEVQAWIQLLDVLANSALLAILAAQQGHWPVTSETPTSSTAKTLNRVGPVLLVLLTAA